MRTVELNGQKVTCEHTYSLAELAVGQKWINEDRSVAIRSIEGQDVSYGDYGNDTTYSCNFLEFQTKFFRVVE